MSHSAPTDRQVAIVSDSVLPGKKRKVTVLEEDRYVQLLEEIVERDFFPDLQPLRSHCQSAPSIVSVITETPAFSGQTDSTACCPETVRSEAPSVQQSDAATPGLGLGQFLHKFTGEDNASFHVLMQNISEREKQKYEWMFLNEDESLTKQQNALSLPAMSEQAGRDQTAGKVLTWPFKNKNSLMYYPAAAPLTLSEEQSLAKRQNSVVVENTRFIDKPFDAMEHQTAIQEAAMAQALAKEAKIGPDGKTVTAPKVAGYSIVSMTPTPSHVLTNASPLMTWGEVDGTPLRISSGTPFRVTTGGPSFRMPQTPAREQLAHSLVDSAAKKHRDKRKQVADAADTRSRVTGKSAQDQLLRMSPAAQRLATKKLGISRSSDLKLLASYTPNHKSMTPSSRTPVPSKTTPAGDRRGECN